MDSPVALAHEAIHEKIGALLSNARRGKLLDVPAGEGALALRLKKLGFEVACCDLYPQIFKLPDTEIRRGNLDAKLPYEDKSFEYVVCIEGLEHIENPANAIREFSRLLKDEGTLIVSVPNIMNVEERLKWLFNGYTSHFKPLSAEALADIRKDFPRMEEIALHVNPIGYSEVRYLLEKNGFAVEKTTFDKRKRNSWAFLPIVGLIKLATSVTSERKRKSRWNDELNSRDILLGGNTLIFVAKKYQNANAPAIS